MFRLLSNAHGLLRAGAIGFCYLLAQTVFAVGCSTPALSDAPFLVESFPLSGYVDPRQDEGLGGNESEGLEVVEITFSEPVQSHGGGPLSIANLIVRYYGPGGILTEAADVVLNESPILSLVPRPDRTLASYDLIAFERFPAGSWTVITFDNIEGFRTGPFSPPVAPLDPEDPRNQIIIGVLPTDFSSDGMFRVADDIVRFNQCYLNSGAIASSSERLSICDITRDGVITTTDIFRLNQLLDSSALWRTYNMQPIPTGPFGQCGNGLVEDGEECDDANRLPADGCSSHCYVEDCTNNRLPLAFAGPNVTGLLGQEAHFSGPASVDLDGYLVAQWWNFGDGISSNSEAPPGEVLIPEISYTYNGVGTFVVTLWVKDNCGAWSQTIPAGTPGDTSRTQATINSCGNDTVEAWEECEGYNIPGLPAGTVACRDYDPRYGSGTVSCNAETCLIDRSECREAITTCGNNIVEGSEECDGVTFPALNSYYCTNPVRSCNYQTQTLRYADGFGNCVSGCSCEIDPLQTSTPSDARYCNNCPDHCGDGVVNCGEVCDPGRTESCPGGTRSCKADCSGWNACVPSTATCGNGVVNSGEQCDCGPGWSCTSTELGGKSCSTFNFIGGNLGCHPPGSALGCSFNRSECTGGESCNGSARPVAVHPLTVQAVVNQQVVLDASGSYDPDGYIKEYAWEFFGVNFNDNATPGETIANGDMPEGAVRSIRPAIRYTYPVAGTDVIYLTVTDNCGKTQTSEAISVIVNDICGNDYRGEGETCERGETRSCAFGGTRGIQSCNAACNGWNACTAFQCPEGHVSNGNGSCTATFYAHPADGIGYTEIHLGIPWNTLRDADHVVSGTPDEGFDSDSEVFVIKNTINPKLFEGERSYLSRYAMSFNTNNLPNDANILGASITLTSFGNQINNRPQEQDFITIVNVDLPIPPTLLTLVSFQSELQYVFELGDNLQPQQATTHRLDVSESFVSNREYVFPLNLAGKSALNTTGWTSYAVRGGYDVIGWGDGSEIVKLAAGFLSGNAPAGRPKLSVTYNVDATRPACGNDIVQSGEQCDGANLANQTCQTRGFVGGNLRCSASCQFDTAQCFQQYPYCLEEGETVPNQTNRPSCCAGLSMIAPKVSGDSSVLGICTNQCGNGVCEIESESRFNCNVDCRYHNNSKNMSLFAPKEGFLVSDTDWQTVLSYLPVTVWTEPSGVKKYPLLIYHEDNFTISEYTSKITSDSFSQRRPQVYGQHVIWNDRRNDNEDEVYYCNLNKNGQAEGCLATDQKRRVTTSDEPINELRMFGNRVAWIQATQTSRGDVFICDLTRTQSTPGACYSTSQTVPVTKRTGSNDFATNLGGISDQYLVWVEYLGSNNYRWYTCDLRLSPTVMGSCGRDAPKKEIQLGEGTFNVALFGDKLAFIVNNKIAACDLDSNEGTPGACYPNDWKYVEENDGFYYALAVYHDDVYWFHYDSFFRHNLLTGQTSVLSTPGKRDLVRELAVSDDAIVFRAAHFSGEDYLMRYDLNTSRYSLIARNGREPSVFGSTIVWAGGEESQPDIYTNRGSPVQVSLNGIDADAVINFLQDFHPAALTLIGATASEVDSLLASAPPLGSGIAQSQMTRVTLANALSFWSSYSSVVYVDNDYELALLAATYASLLNAPLVIQGSFHDRSQTYSGRDTLCIGTGMPSGATCARRYSLEQLRQLYMASTRTDKLILTNPDDRLMATDTTRVLFQDVLPDKSTEKVYELFTRASLSAPILAAAKHELVYTTRLRTWEEIDALLESIARDMFQTVPLRYLTIVASSHMIPKERQSVNVRDWSDDYATDTPKYAEVNGDNCTDLRVGRINGYTLSDISALMARTLFVRDIFTGNEAFMMFLFGASTDDFFRPIQSQFDDWTMLFSEQQAYDEETLVEQEFQQSNLIYYHDHGGIYGIRSFSVDDMQQQKMKLNHPIMSINACDTCGSGDYAGIFCYESLRRGALAYQGAVDTNRGVMHDDYFEPFYREGLSLGEARNKKRNEHFNSYTFCGGDSYYLLFGDPTLTFSEFGSQPRCAGTGACCGNNRVDPGEQCDGTDYAENTCESVGFPGGGYLYCSPSCTFETSLCKEFDCTNNIPPVAILGPNQTGRVGQVLTLDASQSYDPTPGGYLTQYWWSFGDQTSLAWSDNAVVTHAYSAPGTYQVEVWIRDNCPGMVSIGIAQGTVTIQP